MRSPALIERIVVFSDCLNIPLAMASERIQAELISISVQLGYTLMRRGCASGPDFSASAKPCRNHGAWRVWLEPEWDAKA